MFPEQGAGSQACGPRGPRFSAEACMRARLLGPGRERSTRGPGTGRDKRAGCPAVPGPGAWGPGEREARNRALLLSCSVYKYLVRTTNITKVCTLVA